MIFNIYNRILIGQQKESWDQIIKLGPDYKVATVNILTPWRTLVSPFTEISILRRDYQ